MSKRLGLLILACSVGMTACSGGGTPASKRPFAAYRQCLQQHGVTPRRHAGAGGSTSSTSPQDAAAFAAARKACRNLRPAGGLRGGGINSGARSAFRKCMTDHGVTLPTFGPGGPGGTGGTGGTGSTGPAATGTTPPRGGMLAGLNRNDPTVASALAACRSLLGSTTTSTRK